MRIGKRLRLITAVPVLALVAALFTGTAPALAAGQGAPVMDVPMYWTDNSGQGLEMIDTGHNNQGEIKTAVNGSEIQAIDEETVSGVVYFQLEDAAHGLCLDVASAKAYWESCPVDDSNEQFQLTGTNGNELKNRADSEYLTTASLTNDATLSLSATATPSAENQWEYTNPEPATEIVPVDFVVPTSADWTTIADDRNNPALIVGTPIFEACDPLGNCGGAATDANPQWQTTLSTMDSDGISMLYYLSSVSGTVSLSTMETEISNAETWYGSDEPRMGFMIDQVDPTATDTTCAGAATCQGYYQDLDQYIDGNGAGDLDLGVRLMLNPGTPPTANYFGGAASGSEVIQMFENDAADLSSFAMPSWSVGLPDHDFAATVEGADATWDSTNQGYLRTLEADGIGNIYMTNQGSATMGAPYNALPPWWSTLLTSAAAYNPGAGYGLLTVP